MKRSRKAQTVESSLTRQLFNQCQGLSDVINLTLGDPDLLPVEAIRAAACKAIQEGKTRYSENAGIIELRRAIADHIQKEYRITADPDSEILVTVGGMEALYLSLSCLIDSEDEILIPAPYYVNYVQMTNLCGGMPVIVNAKEENGFVVTEEDMEAAVSKRTVALMVNSPANPSGAVWSQQDIDMVCRFAKRHDLTVVSDEVYSSLLFDGKQHCSVLSKSEMKDRTLLIDSISKRFAMTGYRLGYVFGPSEIIQPMIRMQENIAACAPLPSQYAAVEAYRFHADETHLRTVFQERRDYMVSALNETKLLSCRKPSGTFYLFVNIEKTGMDSYSFCRELLQQARVAVAPGITYGKAYDHYIRISCTVDIRLLREAVCRIHDFLNNLRLN